MKKLILFGLVFFLYLSLASATEWVNFDFENNSVTGWTNENQPNAEIISSSTHVINGSYSGRYTDGGGALDESYISITGENNGFVVCEWEVNITSNVDEQHNIYLESVGGTITNAMNINFAPTNEINYYDGSFHTLMTYTEDTVYHIKYVVDTSGADSTGNITIINASTDGAVNEFSGIGSRGTVDYPTAFSMFYNGADSDSYIVIDNLICCNDPDGCIQDTGGVLTFGDLYPANSTQFNTAPTGILSHNTTVNSTTNYNCSLYINGTVNTTQTNYPAGNDTIVDFNISYGDTVESNYSHFISCTNENGNQNTTENYYFIDNVNPIITWTLPANDNSTIFNSGNNSIFTSNIGLTDWSLYNYQFNITNETTHLYNFSDLLNQTATYTIERQANLENHTGLLNGITRVCDGHTNEKISFNAKKYDKELLFADETIKVYPSIKAEILSSDYNHMNDRYSFDFTLANPSYKQVFLVESDQYIDIIQNSKYDGHLITGDYWLDFEIDDVKSVKTKRLTNNKIEVTVELNNPRQYWHFQSIGELNCVLETRQFYTYGVEESYSDTALTQVATDFNLNITAYNSTYITSYGVATLFYNGTSHSVGGVLADNKITFDKSVYPPNITTETNVSWYWNYTVNGLDYQTDIRNQTIIPVQIDNCSTYTTNIMNFTVYDEETKLTAPLYNVSIESDILLYSGLGEWEFNNTQTGENKTTLSICVNSDIFNFTSFKINSTTRYKASEHAVEFHYLQNFDITNGSFQDIKLYTLNTDTTKAEYSTSFLINYQDENFLNVAGAVIDLLRYYVGEGEYVSVENALTDDSGNTRLHFVTEDVKYYVIVRKNNEILYQSSPFLAICQSSPCQINFQEEDQLAINYNYTQEGNLNYFITLDEGTRTATATFNTLDGSTTTANLKVIRFDNYLNVTICDDNLTTSSGSLSCTVPLSARNSTYIVEFGTYNSPLTWVTYRYFSLDPNAISNFGYSGVVMTLLLTLTLVFMAIPSGMTAIIIFGILGIIFASILVIFSGGSIFGIGSSILWLISAGAILIWKANKR